ncbi:MAG: MBL fold metallo-hydrolase, partial [Robiginitomaculum sp.]|nr:MBL fold metallo-hydrolase [Robiginitomaculum sp.]
MISEKPKYKLDFFTDTAPEAGVVTEITDGVFWLRMTLPMAGLDHINLYFVRDGDEFVVIDTGLGWKEAMDIWEGVFADNMGGAHVNRVICTHLHPDHAGLAGWMCRKFGAPLLMTMGEYFLCRLMAADTGNPAPKEGIEFYRRAGFTDEQIENYKSRFGGFGKAISELPNGFQRIRDNDIIEIGGSDWQVV